MRLEISGRVWDGAAVALIAGNQTAAGTYSRLSAALSRTVGMAGDDATSSEFSAAYDDVAAPALGALADLVDSYATLGRLVRASITHHRGADHGSVIGPAEVYDPAQEFDVRDPVTVRRTTAPSSLGGDAAHLPDIVDWVLDQVQGFAWPNADTDRLRTAARAWTSAGNEVNGLARHCLTAERMLKTQRSSETAVAATACCDLWRTTTQLASQLNAIGTSCESYADDVDRQRHAILDLVKDLARDAVIVEGIGFVLGVVTVGLTAAGATAINAAKIAAAAPRVLGLLDALGVLARGGAATLRVARTGLGPVSTTLAKLKAAHVLVFAAQVLHHEPNLRPSNPAAFPMLSPGIDLDAHEAAGGHTLLKHVGKTDEELAERFQREPDITGSSSFLNQENAERVLELALARTAMRTAAWLRSKKVRRVFEVSLPPLVTGRSVRPGGVSGDVSGVRIMLVRDSRMPSGFRIRTAFPIP